MTLQEIGYLDQELIILQNDMNERFPDIKNERTEQIQRRLYVIYRVMTDQFQNNRVINIMKMALEDKKELLELMIQEKHDIVDGKINDGLFTQPVFSREYVMKNVKYVPPYVSKKQEGNSFNLCEVFGYTNGAQITKMLKGQLLNLKPYISLTKEEVVSVLRSIEDTVPKTKQSLYSKLLLDFEVGGVCV